MMKRLISLVLMAIAMTVVAIPQAQAQQSDAERDITAALVNSANCWNRGDLEGYLNIYSNRPEMTIIAQKEVVQGIDKYRKGLAPLFDPANTAARGLRTFEVISFIPIDNDNAVIVISTKRQSSVPAANVTVVNSMLFKRGAFGWHIILNHAS
jgi:ketosteroid isomerase-like protein